MPTTEPEKLAQPASLMRPHAEQEYALELEALAAQDTRPRPPSWNLSPWAVVTYLLGGTLDDGTVISPKYVGPRRFDGSGRRNSLPPTGRYCCWGFPVRPRPGSPNTFRPQSRVRRRSWFKARRVRPRKLSATAGTTHVFSPRGRPPVRWCLLP